MDREGDIGESAVGENGTEELTDKVKKLANQLKRASSNAEKLNKIIKEFDVTGGKNYIEKYRELASGVADELEKIYKLRREMGSSNTTGKGSRDKRSVSDTSGKDKRSVSGTSGKEKRSVSRISDTADKSVKSVKSVLGGRVSSVISSLSVLSGELELLSRGFKVLSNTTLEAHRNTVEYSRALKQMGEQLSSSDKKSLETANNINELSNRWANMIQHIGDLFTPILDMLADVGNNILGVLGFSGAEPKQVQASTKAGVVSDAKQVGFSGSSSRNLADGTYAKATELAGQYGQKASEVAEKLANAWRDGSDAAKEYGVVVNDNVLTGYMASKGVDIANVEITDAMKQFYRYQLLMEETSASNSDTMQDMIKKWTKLGIVIDKTKGKLFSFDEVIQLSAFDPRIPDVGPQGRIPEEDGDKSTPKIDDKQPVSKVVNNITNNNVDNSLNSIGDSVNNIDNSLNSIGDSLNNIDNNLNSMNNSELIRENTESIDKGVSILNRIYLHLKNRETGYEYEERTKDLDENISRGTSSEESETGLAVIDIGNTGIQSIAETAKEGVRSTEEAAIEAISEAARMAQVQYVMQMAAMQAMAIQAISSQQMQAQAGISDITQLSLNSLTEVYNSMNSGIVQATSIANESINQVSQAGISGVIQSGQQSVSSLMQSGQMSMAALMQAAANAMQGISTAGMEAQAGVNQSGQVSIASLQQISNMGRAAVNESGSMWVQSISSVGQSILSSISNLVSTLSSSLSGLMNIVGLGMHQEVAKAVVRGAKGAAQGAKSGYQNGGVKGAAKGGVKGGANALAFTPTLNPFMWIPDLIGEGADLINSIKDENGKYHWEDLPSNAMSMIVNSFTMPIDAIKNSAKTEYNKSGDIVNSILAGIGGGFAFSKSENLGDYGALAELAQDIPIGIWNLITGSNISNTDTKLSNTKNMWDAFTMDIVEGNLVDNKAGNYKKNLTKEKGKQRLRNKALKVSNTASSSKGKGKKFADGGIGTKEIHNATLFEGNKKEAVIPLETADGIGYLSNAMQQASMNNGGMGDSYTININLSGLNVADNDAQWEKVGKKISEVIDVQRHRRGDLNYGSSF